MLKCGLILIHLPKLSFGKFALHTFSIDMGALVYLAVFSSEPTALLSALPASPFFVVIVVT